MPLEKSMFEKALDSLVDSLSVSGPGQSVLPVFSIK